MNAVGIIPARWGSTRFPGKPLALIAGKPLIQRVIERTLEARLLDEVLVATDDQRIVEAAEAAGARAVMTRTDHPSGTDRVAEAAAETEADIIINVQGDEPLIDPLLIDQLVEVLHTDAAWDMATAATPVPGPAELADPSVVQVVLDRNGRALYFSRACIPHRRDADGPAPDYFRHLGIYAYRRPFLERLVSEPPCMLEQAEKLEQLRALYIGADIHVVITEATGPGVDTPADIARAEAVLPVSESC